MEISVDGRIIIDRWPDPDFAEAGFETLHDEIAGDAWLCGRVTMRYFAGGEKAGGGRPRGGWRKGDDPLAFVGDPAARSFAVAIDPSGKLVWKRSEVNGDHVVVVLTGRAKPAHRAFLRERGISYLTAGRDRVDFPAALRELRRRFGIRRLLVEGGGTINASLLHAGLIDELHLLLFPVADGRSDTKSLFETPRPRRSFAAKALQLLHVRRRKGGVLWLRYRVKR